MGEDGPDRGGGAPWSRRELVRVGVAGIGASLAGVSSVRALSAAPAPGPRRAPVPNAGAQVTTRPGEIPRWSGPILDRGPELGPAPARPLAAPPLDEVRVGFVGVGGMGTAHVRNLVRIEGCRVQAICDVVPEHAEAAAELVEAAGFPRPTLYTRGETDFRRLCETEDLDLVYTATPWRWHVPVCVAAMESGKHAATEVPAAITIEEAWRLVETAEARRRHCVMMENVCYGRFEMMVLNLVRRGVLGEILHAECGYLHDLRAVEFADEGEGLWRRAHSMVRDGNLYPTHGLGPVAQCMNVNRGDRLARLTSLSSPSRGLQEYAREHYPEGDPRRREEFVCGDVNTSLIRTARGKTIMVSHDTHLPRPYSRINKIQGTRGLVQGWPHRVHVEGRSPAHEWEEAEAYAGEFEHPLWRRLRAESEGAGHGGMDFIEDWRLIRCLRRGEPLDMDVYDAATWSAVSELSERSVAAGGAPVEFPDFTRGRWRDWPPLGIVEG